MKTMTSIDFGLELERIGSEQTQLRSMETYRDEFAILIHRGLLDALEYSRETRLALRNIILIESVSVIKAHFGYRCLLTALEQVLDIHPEPKRAYTKVISALQQEPGYKADAIKVVIDSLRRGRDAAEARIDNPKSMQWGFPT